MLAKRTLIIILVVLGLGAWYATYKYDRNVSGVSKDETEFMVKRAVSFIKMQGESAAYTEISNRAGRFVDRDLYVVVYTMEGKVLAHGANAAIADRNGVTPLAHARSRGHAEIARVFEQAGR